MKVRDLLNMEIDIDVYDDVCEELGIAFCGPLYLTDAGKNRFSEVLGYNVILRDGICVVEVDAPEGIWQHRLDKATEFFESAAGYCDADDYDRWFSDEPIKEQEKPIVSETVNSERSRTLTVTLHVEDGNAVAEFLEGETGERLSVVVPYSPDEHPDFNEAVGNELYSWLELMMDEQGD